MNVEPTEEFKPIPGYEGIYELSNRGIVYFFKYGQRLIKRAQWGRRHLVVQLSRNKVSRLRKVRNLMIELWVPPRPSDKHLLCHIDGNKKNCALDNLLWAIPKQQKIEEEKP